MGMQFPFFFFDVFFDLFEEFLIHDEETFEVENDEVGDKEGDNEDEHGEDHVARIDVDAEEIDGHINAAVGIPIDVELLF